MRRITQPALSEDQLLRAFLYADSDSFTQDFFHDLLLVAGRGMRGVAEGERATDPFRRRQRCKAIDRDRATVAAFVRRDARGAVEAQHRE